MNQTLTRPRRLTRRQKDVLAFIIQEAQATGIPPSLREIGTAVGLSSSNTVWTHLVGLEKLGYIRRNRYKVRSLQVLLGLDGRPVTECADQLRREVLEAEGELSTAYRAGLADGWKAGLANDLPGINALSAAGYAPEQSFGVGGGQVDNELVEQEEYVERLAQRAAELGVQ